MELNAIAPATAWLEITHPFDGKPTGLSVELRDPYDEAVRALDIQHAMERDTAFRRGAPLTPERGKEMALERFTLIVKDVKFEAGATWNGETPPRSDRLVREMFSTCDWLYGQVIRAAENEALFFRGSATRSSSPSGAKSS